MIGVAASPADRSVICEFFELFKTPWEYYQGDRQYEVLLSDGTGDINLQAVRVVLIFAAQSLPIDASHKADKLCRRDGCRFLAYKGFRIPIYGSSVTFPDKGGSFLVDAESQEPAAYVEGCRGCVLTRVGYDLFHEVRTLLTAGQPKSNAAIPTLDLHIALVRDLIVATGTSLIEIPPVPEGHRFIACLTHDVDHPSIRKHVFDHTMFGFLYRAVVGSLLNLLRGRVSVRQLLANCIAALKLPFVHLGLAKDFWQDFDLYTKLEAGRRSSFFVIPFKGDSGRRSAKGSAPKQRAAAYGASDITGQIHTLMSAGCEIGLHGIDVWCDPTKGREELEEIRRITGLRDIGVRTHWLYADEGSPAALERAGADYDSTVGYNETVGYCAGTTQVYKPLEAARLLELPLHIMDTALFFSGYLNLTSEEANKLVDAIIDNAARFGGVVTVNWHDRSIAPERLWGDFYVQLVEKLKNQGAWFATASDAVVWFRKRRSAILEELDSDSKNVLVRTTLRQATKLPGLRVRVHSAQGECHVPAEIASASTREFCLEEGMHVRLSLNAEDDEPCSSLRGGTSTRGLSGLE
jgi:peptidoglycan/xylan/chitin deacetylase (PgdA/CDA1 family)